MTSIARFAVTGTFDDRSVQERAEDVASDLAPCLTGLIRDPPPLPRAKVILVGTLQTLQAAFSGADDPGVRMIQVVEQASPEQLCAAVQSGALMAEPLQAGRIWQSRDSRSLAVELAPLFLAFGTAMTSTLEVCAQRLALGAVTHPPRTIEPEEASR